MVVTSGFGPESLRSNRSGGTLTKELHVWRKNKRVKRSIVWQIPDDVLKELVNSADTLSDVLRVMELPPIGGNHKTLKCRLDEDKIDYSHVPTGKGSNKGVSRGGFTWSNDVMFQENSPVARSVIRKRIIRDNLIRYECCLCGLGTIWHGKSLVMVLDHINGIRNDHRLENLRFVCPNCNSQLETHCNRNTAYSRLV